MKVAGFTFIRNAVINDYPIVEAILSILPLCDEFVIAHGNSDDETQKLLESLDSPKIRIIRTVWEDDLREGGQVFAQETDKALSAISKEMDWVFYIQGDECLHEKYLEVVKREMLGCLEDNNIEGLLFNYTHFYGSYDFYAKSRRWYRREVRVIKNVHGLKSYRDAQGFRINNRKIKVKHIAAWIYHYGWVKPPGDLNHKVRNFNRFYNKDRWIEENYPKSEEFDYGNADKLVLFEEVHPDVMKERIERTNWKFTFDPTVAKSKQTPRRKLLAKIEEFTNWRPFEYKNYQKIK
jgi:hypothetical protein